MTAPPEHEKLEVYRDSLQVVGTLDRIASGLPEGRADLRDQLRRAAASVPLDIAEGAAEYSPAQKASFYRIARRSAAECLAILDVLDRVEPPHPARREARATLVRASGALTSLVRAIDARPRRRA